MNQNIQFREALRREMKNFVNAVKKENIVVYGGADYGIRYLKLFRIFGLKSSIVAVAEDDPSKWGTLIEGIHCDSIESIVKKYEDPLVIICSEYIREIKKKLRAYHVRLYEDDRFLDFLYTQWMYEVDTPKDNNAICYVQGAMNIIQKLDMEDKLDDMRERLFSYLPDHRSRQLINTRITFYLTGNIELLKKHDGLQVPEYFDDNYVTLGEEEVFVDCGSFSGDSIDDFIESVAGKYDHIYGFEPDARNYKMLCSKVGKSNLRNIDIYEMAVGKEKGELGYYSDGTMGSHISDDGNVVVPVETLDNMINGKVTFIKMDVEGAELDALKGARKIIKSQKPTLAVCIYHKALDIFEIPAYIHDLVPEYNFKIGWHSHGSTNNMILYATIPVE